VHAPRSRPSRPPLLGGSGKTLGYLCPALKTCYEHKGSAEGYPICLVTPSLPSTSPNPRPPRAQVMSPTRELAMQIQKEAEKFGKPLGCRAVAVYGGAPKWQQTQQLQRGCEVVVATPGRMMDMLDLHGNEWGAPATNLKHCRVRSSPAMALWQAELSAPVAEPVAPPSSSSSRSSSSTRLTACWTWGSRRTFGPSWR
jgi:hypothetical protein